MNHIGQSVEPPRNLGRQPFGRIEDNAQECSFGQPRQELDDSKQLSVHLSPQPGNKVTFTNPKVSAKAAGLEMHMCAFNKENMLASEAKPVVRYEERKETTATTRSIRDVF